jgi:trans-2,3-dihydro-3-hydroxyanthranilate isomerase
MQFYIVDVFAEEKYAGNQLAVFRGNPTTEMCLKLAQEMNYQESTFITSETPVNGGYDVRVFTPVNELRFAGHPTLGTAFVLRHEVISEAVPEVRLNMQVGQIPVRYDDAGIGWMQQVAPEFQETYDAAVPADVLGISPDDIDTRYPIQAVSTGLPFIITPLKTLDAVKRANCNLDKFKQMVHWDTEQAIKGLFVFAPETEKSENDIHARAFVEPITGMVEDPATGSANGCFAGWLSKYRYFGAKTVSARVEQGYEIKRPSLLLLDARANGASFEVNVGGRVQMIAKGELVI